VSSPFIPLVYAFAKKGLRRPHLDDLQASPGIRRQCPKREHGSLVVYANTISRTETNSQGENVERQIPFMKRYTVFNVEQADGLPAHYYARRKTRFPYRSASNMPTAS
jgi:antirestriction protein ArdC